MTPFTLKYVRGDGGNSRYFYPETDKDKSLLRHLIGETAFRFEEYEEDHVRFLAEAHGWRIIEVKG